MTLESELEFPELPPAEAGSPVDVRVRLGVVPEHIESPVRTGVLFEARPGTYRFGIEDTARYLVEGGNRVTIDVRTGAEPRRVRVFFLGSVLTAILHQRGRLVLHAAVAQGANGAVAIAGHSGRGKSTLLTALSDRGVRVLADDAAAIDVPASGDAIVYPGFPQVGLWTDALGKLGRAHLDLPRVHTGIEKFVLPMGQVFDSRPAPLRHICILSMTSGSEIESAPLTDANAFAALRAHTRNLRVLEGLGMQAQHFHAIARLAGRVPIVQLSRPRDRDSIDALAAHVLRLLQ